MRSRGRPTLDEQEEDLHQLVRRYPSPTLLRWVAAIHHEQQRGALRESTRDVRPFVAATISEIAMRVSNPDRDRIPSRSDFLYLAEQVQAFLFSDPIAFDPDEHDSFMKSHPLFAVLRIIAAQWQPDVNDYGRLGRPLVLFQDVASNLAERPGVPAFDFDGEFEKIYGLPLEPFISVSLLAHAAASTWSSGFTGGYFAAARRGRLILPREDLVLAALNQLVGDPERIRKTHDSRRHKDRRFRMYDYNAMFSYPILRPYRTDPLSLDDQCRLIAPLPDLITYKVSTGIYQEMKRKLGRRFTSWFGYLFEMYIGELLRHSVAGTQLFSEADIRATYPETSGRVCDWVVLDGNTCILIECKATEFHQDLLPQCDPEKIQDNLQRTREGLSQLFAFQQAIMAKASGLERFHHVTKVLAVLVTLEPLYLLNSPMGRDYMDEQLANDGIPRFSWQIHDMQTLEILQPHLAAGVGLGKALEMIDSTPLSSALERIMKSTGRTFKDSCLMPRFDRLTRALGIAGTPRPGGPAVPVD